MTYYGLPSYQPFHYCGCSYIINRTKHYLPQLQLDAHTKILSNTSRTTLKQNFSNPSSDPIKQCIYTFPLYDGVSVVAFTCRVGHRLLRGLVKERTQAKATYDSAVSRGETAGLLEQLPEASDVFTTRLGNVPANEKVHVEITYVGELKHDAEADGIRHTLPTRIAPRYGSLPNSRLSQGSKAQEKGGISITVDVSIAQGSFIRGLQSPTHPIAVTMGNTSTSGATDPAMHRASATLSLGSTELEKDFVLIVLIKDLGTPKALLENHPSIPDQRAMLLTLVPKFSLPRSNPEIVFVADRSGSMRSNIPTLVSALKVFLKSLPVGVRFNICSFGSSHTFLWPKSQAYSRDSMGDALAHVEGFDANYGGTETFGALKATIDNRYPDIPCEVMLLTDGDIWNQSDLFTYLNDEVKKSASNLRVFALGIGDGVSHALIEGVARAGNGFAQTVNNDEKLDSKVIRMLKGGLSPHTTDYSLEVKYDDADEGFEMVEKVTDALKVMLSEGAAAVKSEVKENEKPTSFFDTTIAQPSQEKPPSADNGQADPFAHLPAVSVPMILQAPQFIPPLYPFSRTSVYLLFSGKSARRTPRSVFLRAKSGHGPLELEIPVETLTNHGETIHQLAARKAIQELEEGRGWLYEAQDESGKPVKERYVSRFDEMVQREAVRIGVQFQVGGKWCSFVAVKDNDKHKSESKMDSDSENDTVVLTPPFETEDEDGGFEIIDDDDHGNLLSASCDTNEKFRAHGGVKPRRKKVGSRRAPYSSSAGGGGATYSSLAGGGGATFGPTLNSLSQGRRGHGFNSGSLSSILSIGAPATREAGTASSMSFGNASHVANVQYYSGFGSPSSYTPATRGASKASEPPAKKMDTDNDKVHAVIQAQDFEGWWEQSHELFTILGVRVSGQQSKEWVTVLVMKWLDVKMAAEKEVWELVADKAKGWLEGRAGTDRLMEIEKEVVLYIH